MNPARHQVIARALRSRLREDRGLDLQELQLRERAAGALQQPVAQDEVALQFGAPEVEHPMLEPQLFCRQLLVLLPRHRDGRRLRRTDDLQLGQVHLDLPRYQRRVAGRLRTERHRPARQHDRFCSEGGRPRHDLRRGPVGIARELDQAGAIAQVDEHQAAQVAAPVHPPAKPDLLADVRARQLATAVRAEGGGAQVSGHGAGGAKGVNALRRRGGRGRTHRRWWPRAVAGAPYHGAPDGRFDSGS